MATQEEERTMCPFCITTVGLIVAGAVSSGGLAILAWKGAEQKSDSTQTIPSVSVKERNS
jgi:hypothetical protein